MKKILSVLIAIFLFNAYCPAQNVDIQTGIWSCYFNPGGNGGSSEVSFVDVDELGRYYCVGSCMQSNQGFSFNEFLGAGQTIRKSGMFKTKMGKSHFGNNYFFYYNDGGTLCKNGSNTDFIYWDTTAATLTYPLNISMYEDYQENVYLYKKDTIKKYDINRNFLWMIKTKATYVTGDLGNNIYVAGDSISKFDQNGNPQWYYPAVASKLVIDNKGNTYFRHAGNNLLTKIDSFGNLVSSGPLVIPYYGEFAVDTNDNIYVLDGNQVQKYDSSGLNLVWTVTLSGYSAISADAHQNCYLAGYYNNTSAYPPYGGAYYARISSLQPPDTITCYVTDTLYCAGDSAEVYFNTSPLQNSGAQFKVYLSDTAGNFAVNATSIGTGLHSPIKFKLPAPYLVSSAHYRIMVKVTPLDTTVVNIPSGYMTINALPVVSLNPPYIKACYGDSIINMNPLPLGGTLTGPGVYGYYFIPDSANISYNNRVTYAYTDSNMCSNSTYVNMEVGSHIIPTVTFSDDTICFNPYPYTPVVIINYTPPVSYININGLNTNNNNPFYLNTPRLILGTNIIQIVSNNYGCKDTIVDYVFARTVDTLFLNFSDDSVCVNGSPVLLTGTPAGGNYLGTGVTGSYFYPAPNMAGWWNTVWYEYTDSNGCYQSIPRNIFVDACLGLGDITYGSISIAPNPATSTLFVTDRNFHQPYTIFVNDLFGRHLMQLDVKSAEQYFNIATLAKGVYFLQYESESNKRSFKLIKQ